MWETARMDHKYTDRAIMQQINHTEACAQNSNSRMAPNVQIKRHQTGLSPWTCAPPHALQKSGDLLYGRGTRQRPQSSKIHGKHGVDVAVCHDASTRQKFKLFHMSCGQHTTNFAVCWYHGTRPTTVHSGYKLSLCRVLWLPGIQPAIYRNEHFVVYLDRCTWKVTQKILYFCFPRIKICTQTNKYYKYYQYITTSITSYEKEDYERVRTLVSIKIWTIDLSCMVTAW